MPEFDPTSTFRGLPLTAEQDEEIRRFIKQGKLLAKPLDVAELEAMLRDMLEPPSNEDERIFATDSIRADAERAEASIDEAMEPTEASEERNAAMESEAMKRPQH